MNGNAEVVIISMMLRAQQHTIFKRVDSPSICLCLRARTRERIVGIFGISEWVIDHG
jgi:hypothetical protein